MTLIRSNQPLPIQGKPSTGVNHSEVLKPLGDMLQCSVRFKGNAPPPSVWARLKQGVQRLWQKLISPFQRFSAWIQKQFNPPAKAATEAAAKPNAAHEPAAPNRPVAQTAVAPDQKPSTPPAAGVANVSPASPTENNSIELTQIVTPDSPPARPTTPPHADSRAVTGHQGRTAIQAEPHIESQQDLDLQTAIKQSEISANEEAARRLAQEELENNQQNQALQLSQIQQDEALAKQLAAEELDAAKAQPLAAGLVEGASSSQVAQAASVANTTSPALMKELFGTDLKSIQFQQQQGDTCYLLAALNSIFHHPQGKRILESIQIQAIPDGYRVEFPGQKGYPVDVLDHELGYLTLANGNTVNGVVSETKGVKILECAYSKLDTHIEIHENDRGFTEGFGKFFGVEHCLKALFGGQNITLPRPNKEENLLSNALNNQRQRTDFADIWTGQQIHHVYANNKITPELARHYESVVPLRNEQNNLTPIFQVKDPFKPQQSDIYDLENLDQKYQVSSVRIRLPIASEST